MAKRISMREQRQQEKEQAQQQQQAHHTTPQAGQGVKAYTGTLKEDGKHQTDEPTTKITLRVPISISQLIDEVFGKKKLRQEVGTKYEFIAGILRPSLEAEKKRLLELDIQELEAKKEQLVILSDK